MKVVARALAALVVVTGALAISGVAAAEDGCPAVMTFQFDPEQGALVLSPASVTVPAGSCVTFNNQTATFTTFAVGGGYQREVPPFSETVGDGNYQASSAGTTQQVTATSRAGSASGSIVIQAAPASGSPPPPPSTTSAPPPSSPPTSSKPPATHPTPARSKKKPPAPTVTASAPPVLPLTSSSAGQPPLVEGRPSPTPSSSSSPAIVTGSLQPPTGRGTGLPAALAALAIVGTAAALLRVLLAYPISAVDGAHSVRMSS